MDIVKRTIRDIKSLKIQGASNVRKKAIEALLVSSLNCKITNEKEFRQTFLKNSRELANARPTEPELRTAIRIIKKSISEKNLSVKEMQERINEAVTKYDSNRKIAMEQMTNYGAKLIKPKSTILTICHSSTVVKMLIKAKCKIKKVYCCETRPLYQGRITAKKLSDAGINVTLIVDNAASTVMKECNYFFSGADSILADGDVINKIGTNQISSICKKYDVLHYVVASTHKFEPETFFGKDEIIEQRETKEVIDVKDKNYSKKIKVINPAFDRSDSKQIEGIICEKGIFTPTQLTTMLFNKLELNKRNKAFLKL
ncbi:MAG: Ribose 1,5-bisphosphate isomerase [archaeon ADurb.Bin336]|nr:MAG: Ribose 1,5-bisphosphate isomerase [archaeon ADurb.Bin336]